MFTDLFRRSRLPGAVALLLSGSPGLALAAAPQPEGASVSFEVPTADLDLASARGEATLLHRVDVAALKACEAANSGDGMQSPGVAECFRGTVAAGWLQAKVKVAAARDGAHFASANR